jgi:CHRD domain
MRCKLLASAMAAFMLVGAHANAEEFSAKLVGFQETPAAIFSPGKGTLDLDLDRAARTLTFKLTFSGLTSPATQSHIHFGKEHVTGGVIVFFCSNLNNGPAGTQLCPAGGGTVTGTIVGGAVVGPTAQNITPGNFDALVAALASNTAYGNVHSQNFPGGEIRGQIRRADDDDDRDRK